MISLNEAIKKANTFLEEAITYKIGDHVKFILKNSGALGNKTTVGTGKINLIDKNDKGENIYGIKTDITNKQRYANGKDLEKIN